MADNLTDGAETRALQWLLGQASTAPVLPLMVRLMTANGTDAAAGTQVAGGTYAPQQLSAAAVAAGASSNATVLRYDGMPACTVVGVEIWDSAGVPFRWWWGALVAPKTVAAGESFEIPIGDLDLSIG